MSKNEVTLYQWRAHRDIRSSLLRMSRDNFNSPQVSQEVIGLSVRPQLTSEICKLLGYLTFNFSMLNVLALH